MVNLDELLGVTSSAPQFDVDTLNRAFAEYEDMFGDEVPKLIAPTTTQSKNAILQRSFATQCHRSARLAESEIKQVYQRGMDKHRRIGILAFDPIWCYVLG